MPFANTNLHVDFDIDLVLGIQHFYFAFICIHLSGVEFVWPLLLRPLFGWVCNQFDVVEQSSFVSNNP